MGIIRKTGFAVIEIAIIVAIIILIIFIAVPKVLKQNHDTNQVAAIDSLNAISSAMENYHSLQKPPSYRDANLITLTEAGFLSDAGLAKGARKGYIFTLVVSKGASPQAYTCLARPQVSEITGTEVYQITESGVVEVKTVDGWQAVE